jgi:hypothetical protein
VAERGGRDLLDEWRAVMEAVVASAAGRAELPRDLLRAMQRQVELVQEVIEREEGLRKEIAGRIVAPIDAVFDLLETTGATLREQAEALESAGRALEEAAGVAKRQAELFEKTIATLRQPADLARTATGLGPRTKRGGGRAPRG